MRPRHRTTAGRPAWYLLPCLLLASAGTPAAAGESRIHPACFEPFVQEEGPDRHPDRLRLDACTEHHADEPITEFQRQFRYERPPAATHGRGGSLAYERISGTDDRVIYRLIAVRGRERMTTRLITGREVMTSQGRELRDIDTRDMNDRCRLGDATVQTAAGDVITVGIPVTPSVLPQVLAAPDYDIPEAERDRERVRYAFGDHLVPALEDRSTTRIGTAIYTFATDNDCWHLARIELDSLDAIDRTTPALLRDVLRESATETPSGYVIPGESSGAIQRRLVSAHPSPLETSRLQFWLRRLGYYWLAPVDGIAGARTRAAIGAWRADQAEAGAPELTKAQAETLVLAGLRYSGSRVHPVDETGMDTDFAVFMDELRRATDRRDTNALIEMSTPDVIVGPDGDGRSDLRAWFDDPRSGDARWRQLADTLALGAVRQGPDAYCRPYTRCLPTRLLAGHEPSETVLTTAADADLLSAPRKGATRLRALDHDMLTLIDADPVGDKGRFLRVRTTDGTEGFAARDETASPTAQGMSFLRRAEGWRIERFAGD